MIITIPTYLLPILMGVLIVCVLFGCSMLVGDRGPATVHYSFDAVLSALPRASDSALLASGLLNQPTIYVAPIKSAAGFDSNKIVYIRQQFQPNYYRLGQWVDAPAVMLEPIVISALQQVGLNASNHLSTAKSEQFQLNIDILRLQQEFFSQPSKVHFTIRMRLIDQSSGALLVDREFNELIPSATEDTYGGVVAANAAVRAVLDELATLCRGELALRHAQ